jgi:hypothetical protein
LAIWLLARAWGAPASGSSALGFAPGTSDTLNSGPVFFFRSSGDIFDPDIDDTRKAHE